MLNDLAVLPILLFSIIVHEISHGLAALKLGDPTARDMGRLTLNPVPHIDPIGSILIPLLSLATAGQVFIAWAKPVPVNPLNFAHPRRDDILVSVIGPLSNIAMALLCSVAAILIGRIDQSNQSSELVRGVVRFALEMFLGGISLNVVLALFNLIPVPPLDGSHVLASLLPHPFSEQYRRIGFFGIFALILLMRWPPFLRLFHAVLSFCISPFEKLVQTYIG